MAAAPAPAVSAAEQAAGLAPLTDTAFRFTAVREGGRSATIYEGRRSGAGTTRTIVDLVADANGGWAVATRETKYLAGETFDYFVARIDAAAKTPAVGPCTDGAALFAQHGDKTAAGCTADDPASRIARALGLIDEEGPTLLK